MSNKKVWIIWSVFAVLCVVSILLSIEHEKTIKHTAYLEGWNEASICYEFRERVYEQQRGAYRAYVEQLEDSLKNTK